MFTQVTIQTITNLLTLANELNSIIKNNKKRKRRMFTQVTIQKITNLLTLANELNSIVLRNNALENLIRNRRQHTLVIVES